MLQAIKGLLSHPTVRMLTVAIAARKYAIYSQAVFNVLTRYAREGQKIEEDNVRED